MAGFEPATSSLPRKCSTPELHRHGLIERKTRLKLATLSLEGWCSINWATSAWELWAKMDSNHRRYKPADLQSAPFGHSGIRPYNSKSYLFPIWASCRIRTNDPEITNHVLWPTELKRHLSIFFLLGDSFVPFCGCKVTQSFETTKIIPLFFELIFQKIFHGAIFQAVIESQFWGKISIRACRNAPAPVRK